MELETIVNIEKVVHNIRRMLIEQYLNFDEENPNKSMAAAMTGDFDNIDEIQRLLNIDIDLSDESLSNVSEHDYYLCKNRITRYNKDSNETNEAVGEKRMGYIYMLIRKEDTVCSKWVYVSDACDKDTNKEYEWMGWTIVAANWVIYTLPTCNTDGFVYGSLME